jgi:phage shock protein PspC (stress-responsive transcriptional regulator)
MNKVVNINLNGLVFSIDEIAYEQLKQYIDKLKAHFGNTAMAAEIIQDIEARIAELLQAKLTDRNTVVQPQDVSEVIAIMGAPGEMDDEQTEEPKQKFAQQDTSYVKKLRRDPNHKTFGGVCAGLANYFGVDIMIPRIAFLIAFFAFGSGLLVYLIMWIIIPEASLVESSLQNAPVKRLFRNPDDKKLGGVCAGIAEYLSVDTLWLRLAFLIAFFVFGTGLLAYIILWIAIPLAKTSTEKLQMKGAPVDVNNIEKEVRGAAHNVNAAFQKSGLSEIARVLVKIISKLIGAAFLIVGIILLGVIIFLWNYSFANILDRLDITAYYSYFEYGFGLFVFSMAALIIVTGFKFLFHTSVKIKYLSFILGLCAIAGLALILSFAFQYRQSVVVKTSIKESIIHTPCPDTLYININKLYSEDFDGDDDIDIRINKDTYSRVFKTDGVNELVKVFYNTKLSVKPSKNDSLHFYLVKSARGENDQNATDNTRKIAFTTNYQANTLTIDEGISLTNDEPFKYQQVSAKLRVPVGTIIKVDKHAMKMIDKTYEEDFDLGETFRMTEKGLRCLDCVDTEDESDEDVNIEWNVDEDDGEVNIKIRKEQKTEKADTLGIDSPKHHKRNRN